MPLVAVAARELRRAADAARVEEIERGMFEEAAALYRDNFLAGFTLRDSPGFDDWQFFQAESLRRELAAALERLVRAHCARAEYEPAIDYARRWLRLDPHFYDHIQIDCAAYHATRLAELKMTATLAAEKVAPALKNRVGDVVGVGLGVHAGTLTVDRTSVVEATLGAEAQKPEAGPKQEMAKTTLGLIDRPGVFPSVTCRVAWRDVMLHNQPLPPCLQSVLCKPAVQELLVLTQTVLHPHKGPRAS